MPTHSLTTRTGTFRVRLDGPDHAPALVLSNSLGTPLEMWDRQAAALSGDFRVVRYDTRGHGSSEASPGPYTLRQLGDDVLALLDALEIGKASFCGISMGGITGLWLGVHAPHRLERLMVSNSAARIGTAAGWQERAGMVLAEQQAGMRSLAATAPGRWFTPAFVQAAPQVVRQAQQWIAATPPHGYAACCQALADADLREDIHRVAMPAWIVAGTDDPVTTVADATFMAQAIAGAQMHELPASHLSNIEAADGFNVLLHAFMQAG